MCPKARTQRQTENVADGGQQVPEAWPKRPSYDRGMGPERDEASLETGTQVGRSLPTPVAPTLVEPSDRICHVTDHEGTRQVRFDRENVEALLATGRFFWLDLYQPQESDYAILRQVFNFHPLAVEDSEHFGQRAKLDDYDDFVFLVVYGGSADKDRLVELHCFYSERSLVTVHRDDCPALAEIGERYRKRDEAVTDPSLLLYRIVDGLVDSFFPILAEFDDRIDELEDQIFLRAGDEQLQEIFTMKRLLVGMRQAISPQRDLFAKLIAGVGMLPGMSEEDERYYRDV